MSPSGSILVTDTDPVIADLLVEILTDAGYIAYATPNDTIALAAIARHAPALLLLDLGYTGIRNATLIEQMRQEGRATMPIVIMTTAPLDTPPLLGGAVTEYLAKPFDLDVLLACVARYVLPSTAEPALLARSA